MPDNERPSTEKEQLLREQAHVLGLLKLSPNVEKFLNAHPDIKEKLLGDAEQRKFRYDLLNQQMKELEDQENRRLQRVSLRLKAIQDAKDDPKILVGTPEYTRLAEQEAAALKEMQTDSNMEQQIQAMRNEAISTLRGDDIANALTSTVQIGNQRLDASFVEDLRNNPVELQRVLNNLQDEIAGGNLESKQQLRDLTEYFTEDFIDSQMAQLEAQQQITQAPGERIRQEETGLLGPVRNIIRNIQERLQSLQGKPQESIVTSPQVPEGPVMRVEASRRQSLKSIQSALREEPTLRFRGVTRTGE